MKRATKKGTKGGTKRGTKRGTVLWCLAAASLLSALIYERLEGLRTRPVYIVL